LLSTAYVNESIVEDLLMVGQSDIEGNVEIINKGQLSGDPLIVLAQDLYSVNEAIKKESDVKLLLIDVSNNNLINHQLDVLDELAKKDFPIVGIFGDGMKKAYQTICMLIHKNNLIIKLLIVQDKKLNI
jgi:hypothetical protein